MKKTISVLLIVLISSSFILAQSNYLVEINSLQKRIKNSDEKIKDEAKNKKVATWTERAKLHMEASKIVTSDLYYGMPNAPLEEIEGSLFMNVKVILGEPDNQEFLGSDVPGDERWNYEYLYLIFKAKKLIDWKQTKAVVDEPLVTAYEAYMKAIEVDEKGKYKNKKSTHKNFAEIKVLLYIDGYELNGAGEYNKAFDYLEKSIALDKYPRVKSDTTVSTLDYYYLAAHFALVAGSKNKAKIKKYTDSLDINAKNKNLYNEKINYYTERNKILLPKAVEYYNYCIDNEHKEIGTCYANLARAKFEEGDDAAGLEILEKGTKAYPNEKEIIYGLINYYTPKGEYGKAFEYIDAAIALDKSNYLLYIVKADASAKVFYDFKDKYYKAVEQSDSLKKLAYRLRNKPEEQKPVLDEKKIVDVTIPDLEKNKNEYFIKAEDAYKLGFENCAEEVKTVDAHYTFGELYYFNAIAIYNRAQDLPSKEIDKYNAAMTSYKDNLKLSMVEMEKVNELAPTDVYALQYLSFIYNKLKMKEKQKEVKAELDRLTN